MITSQWAKARQTLLQDIFRTKTALDDQIVAYEQDGADDASMDERLVQIGEIQTQFDALRKQYLEQLPRVPLSRCPFSGKMLQRHIDLGGLDGLWWNYDEPLRVYDPPLPTFFAMEGAVKLQEPVADVPFPCQVGPEVPFVLPRLLQYEAIKAVISSVALGGHRLYLTTYYAEPIPHELRRVNDLGSYCYTYVDQHGWLQHDYFQDPQKDFDLEEWVALGKLLWIAPDDPTLTLQGTLTGFPYQGLPGRRQVLHIIEGRAEAVEEPEWIVDTGDFLPDGTEDLTLEALAREIGEEEEWLLDIHDVEKEIPDEWAQLTEEEIDEKLREEE